MQSRPQTFTQPTMVLSLRSLHELQGFLSFELADDLFIVYKFYCFYFQQLTTNFTNLLYKKAQIISILYIFHPYQNL